MSPEEIKQDFETALLKHHVFKSKLRSFLYGVNTEETPIRDPEVCGLGQWIRERGFPLYGQLPDMHQFDRLHRLVHEQANAAVDAYQADQRDEAMELYAAMKPLMDQLAQLLSTMQQQLRNGA